MCTVDGHCDSYCGGCEFDEVCSALDFELGNLYGWYVAGDGRVVASTGGTVAPQGEYMALVSSAVGKMGMIAFGNCISQVDPLETVSMSLKFYSEEFTEYCGSVFQDKVVVYLEMGVETRVVFSADIRDFCPPEACAGCGSQYVSLEQADIALDQGDAYMTGWIDVEGDVLGFVEPGQKFYVTILVQDGNDAKYDSLVLVDNIVLGYCEPDCGGKVCGEDGCKGSCGECEEGWTCEEGVCLCTPDCEGKLCGDDGCEGS